MKIQNAENYIAYAKNLAKKEGRYYMPIPLKDKSTAYVLLGKNSLDCFVTNENGQIQEACGASGSYNYIQDELIKLITKLLKI